jgi:chromosome partitioning protein
LAKVYAVIMNKGGVGKTTLITQLAYRMGVGKRVLVIDMDGQGNATIAFGVNPNKQKNTIYQVMMGKVKAQDAVIKITDEINLIPANYEIDFLEHDVWTQEKEFEDPFNLLRRSISNILDSYDYIFIDTPPSLGLATENVLSVADEAFIPFVPEKFSVQGLIRVIDRVNDANGVKISGVIASMVDRRTKMHSTMINQARSFCEKKGIRMLSTVIPRTIELSKSSMNGEMSSVKVVEEIFNNIIMEVTNEELETAKA